jgi:hypothetical protein
MHFLVHMEHFIYEDADEYEENSSKEAKLEDLIAV